MPEQADFPDRWQCASDNKRVTVEIRVPHYDGYTTFSGEPEPAFDEYRFIEIPTQSVELWIEKGEAASIQRTAKVVFPTEWGENTSTVEHNSPRNLIDQYSSNGSSPFMAARIWFQDEATGDWVINHFGWVGGVGPASNSQNSKLWVYDFAELLSGVPIGLTFNNPTIGQALSTISNETNRNTPIPLSNAVFIPPGLEELQATYVDAVGGRIGEERAEELATLVFNAQNVQNGQYHSLPTMGVSNNLSGTRSNGEYLGVNVPTNRSPKGDRDTITSQSVIDTGSSSYNLVDESKEELWEVGTAVAEGDIEGAVTDVLTPDSDRTSTTKSFTANHDTLLDVYDWFEKKVGAKLHFEPEMNSVVLTADVEPSRRVWAQDSVVEHVRSEDVEMNVPSLNSSLDLDYTFHDYVSVHRNDALYEMKPTNTLHLRGAASKQTGFRDRVEQAVGTTLDASSGDLFGTANRLGGLFDSSEPESSVYPAITVQSPALLEAAEGVELSPEAVESDAESLDVAEKEAISELTSILEEVSEGEIVVGGKPRMLPYDRIDSFEVCNGLVEYEQIPVSYEIESVKHTKTASSEYETELSVSIWANEKTIQTTRKELVRVE